MSVIVDVQPSEQAQPFANELLLLIFQHFQNDLPTLHSLNLVNNLFNSLSQPLLYHQITSTLPSHHTSFFYALTRKPHVAKFVKRYDAINLVVDMDKGFCLTTLYMIGQMTNLEDLALRIYDTHCTRALFHTNAHGLTRLESTHFKNIRLRSFKLRRSDKYLRLEEAWWIGFIQSQAQTLEVLDLGDAPNFYPYFGGEAITYPELRIVQGDWELVVGILPKAKLRIVDVTGEMSTIVVGLDRQVSMLEGFCSRFVGGTGQKALLLPNVVSWLHGVKYLGLAHDISDLTYVKFLIEELPPTGLNGLQAISLLCNNRWDPSNYQNINSTPFIDIFKTCPALRFIDIELPNEAMSKTRVSSYYRIECKVLGDLFRNHSHTFQADAVFDVYEVTRSSGCFYFE